MELENIMHMYFYVTVGVWKVVSGRLSLEGSVLMTVRFRRNMF